MVVALFGIASGDLPMTGGAIMIGILIKETALLIVPMGLFTFVNGAEGRRSMESGLHTWRSFSCFPLLSLPV
jgi:hypothetical protein